MRVYDKEDCWVEGVGKKIKELESANDILKKALAFFAESQKK